MGRRVGTARARGGVWRHTRFAALALAQDDGSACMKAAQILGVLADYNPSELTFQLTKLAKPICMHRFEVLKWLADCPLSKRPPAIHWAHGR